MMFVFFVILWPSWWEHSDIINFSKEMQLAPHFEMLSVYHISRVFAASDNSEPYIHCSRTLALM